MTDSIIKPDEDGEDTNTDRLSNLPDSLICHIMSFLPTRTSVATMSLVSPRYLHLWKDLQVFDFEDKSDDEHPEIFRKFAVYVDNVLALRKSQDILNFHLSGEISYDARGCNDYIDKWIRAAIGPHLQELYLNFDSDGTGEKVLLPSPSIFNCTNLVSLSLVGDIYTNVQNFSFHFPLLKALKLDIDTVNKDLVVSLLSGCPVLETLDYCFDFDPRTKVVQTPSSKRFEFTNENFSWTCLEIDTNYDSSIEKKTVGIIGCLESVVEAYLDVFSLRESEFVYPILKLIRDQLHFIHIRLQHSTSKWPLHAPTLNHPEFHNLHNLKFILPCFNSNLLVNVIEKCHMLQVLIIQSNKEEPSSLRTWEPQSITVPKCLESHLNYIHIEGYQGFEDELTFAEYILRNGLVLKTMLIFVDISMDITNKECSLKRLMDIPRGSVMCQLKFDSVVSP